MSPWTKALVAGVISGAAQGVLTGLAASGIAPNSFNLTTHVHNVFLLAGMAAAFGALIGAAAYLTKSPLP